jgi:alpha/beta superfamily hydrolase
VEGHGVARREERSVTIPLEGGGLALDALYVAADPTLEDAGGAVIAAPHPLYGGSMGSPVVSELSWAIARTGRATLRFDWRGVGASGGRPSGDLAHARADYRAALAQLAESVPGPLIAAGYSFGAAAALCAQDEPRVRTLVLVAPPPSLLDRGALAACRREVWIVTGEHDAIAPAGPLEALARDLPRARFARIDDADHFFGAGLGDVGKLVTRWLEGES